MSKVRNFAGIAPNIGFSEFDFYDLYRSTFEKSELGRIKSLLPLHEMAENFGLVSKSQTRKMTRRLIDLLGKILKEIREMERDYEKAESLLTAREKGDLDIITRMYRQQKSHFNRDFCRENGIQTSFAKRGRPFSEHKEKDFARQELARVRATVMEGSFGTQKEHYDLRRVKARTKLTEILYIFFGIHTANVVQLADRIERRAKLAVA